MNKEQQIMDYLHKHVFDPILNCANVRQDIKNGTNLTIARMSRLSAEKMIQYFWTSLVKENSINFSKNKKAEGLIRFEDIMEDFRDKFNESWLKS